jgi:hypothetical protein
MAQVNPTELIRGKFYEVRFRSGDTYLCQATSSSHVRASFRNGISHEATGGIHSAVHCIEISEAYYRTGKKEYKTNDKAKVLLDQEW